MLCLNCVCFMAHQFTSSMPSNLQDGLRRRISSGRLRELRLPRWGCHLHKCERPCRNTLSPSHRGRGSRRESCAGIPGIPHTKVPSHKHRHFFTRGVQLHAGPALPSPLSRRHRNKPWSNTPSMPCLWEKVCQNPWRSSVFLLQAVDLPHCPMLWPHTIFTTTPALALPWLYTRKQQ